MLVDAAIKKNQTTQKSITKDSLLEEMKALIETHLQRTANMEASTERFEKIVQDLHANNVAKSKEMVQYQKRIEQIDETVVSTAKKN